MINISEERLSELAEKIWISDHETHKRGHMALELGIKVGLKTGYPELQFSQYDDEYYLEVRIPSSDYGYDTRRDISLVEMLTFILVAKKKFPDERLTKELIKKVKTLLTNQKNEITLVLEQIEQPLETIL